MGIRFRCPNGHKLNIKTFLAGKRGVCPDCGTSFRIPTEEAAAAAGKDLLTVAEWKSSREEEVSEASESFAASGGAAVAVASKSASAVFTPSSLATTAPATKGSASSAAPVVKQAAQVVSSAPSVPQQATAVVAQAASIPIAAPSSVPVSPASPATPNSGADPFAEAPLANWYVRSPAGGQYGPAKGDVMRKWIAEGRVSADSLVWREGFPEWRVASDVFPSLGRSAVAAMAAASVPTAAPAAPMAAVPPTAAPDPTPAASARTLQRYAARKQTSNFFGLVAFFGLIVLCLGLVIVLAVLLSRSYNEPQEKEKAAEKAAKVLYRVTKHA
ncbi:MAG: GYF domain-containing protein [Planctomycetaceae bacterium]